jgi:hypothetical protein
MQTSKSKPVGKPASTGAYGAKPHDPTERRATALLAGIQMELGDVGFFTREDLLHLSALSYVATITRYTYVREAVGWLLERDKLHAISKTELCLRGRQREYLPPDRLIAQYRETVLRIVRTMAHGGDVVSVRDVLDGWQGDTHLSLNVKRVMVRKMLAHFTHDGLLVAMDEPGSYVEASEE